MINMQMKQLVEEKKTIDPHFYEGVKANWEKMVEVLSVNLDWTIAYIETASREEISQTCEVWDDISEFWKSQKLIEAMERCKERFPDLAKELEINIAFAKKALEK